MTRYIIKQPKVPVREETRSDAPSLSELTGGDEVEGVTIIRVNGSIWIELLLPNGKRGFIPYTSVVELNRPGKITEASLRGLIVSTIAFFLIFEIILLAIVLFAPWALMRLLGALGMAGMLIVAIARIWGGIKKEQARQRFRNMDLAQLQDPNSVPRWDVSLPTLASETIFGPTGEAWFETLVLKTSESTTFEQDAAILQQYYLQILSDLKKFMDIQWKWTEAELAKPKHVLSGNQITQLEMTLRWLDENASVYQECLNRGGTGLPTWDTHILHHEKSLQKTATGAFVDQLEITCNPRVIQREIDRIARQKS